MPMSSEQRHWVFITRDKFFTILPIMVFGQTSVGNSEFDVWHFFNQLFPHTLLFQEVHISVLSPPEAICGAGDMSGNASCQANSTLIIESFF